MHQLCRLCLEEIKENGYVPIYEPALLEQIFTFTSVELKCNNGLFERLCRQCYGYICKCNKFRNRCREANEWLLRIIEWQKHNISYSRIPTETIVRILKNQSENDPLIDPIHIKSQPLPVKAPGKKDAATSPIQFVQTRDVCVSTEALPGKDIGVSTNPLWMTRSIGVSTDAKISRLHLKNVGVDSVARERRHVGIGTSDYKIKHLNVKSVGVNTSPCWRRRRHKGIGTSDFETPLKTGFQSVGVETSDLYWFNPNLRDVGVGTDNFQSGLAVQVMDNWTSMEGFPLFDEDEIYSEESEAEEEESEEEDEESDEEEEEVEEMEHHTAEEEENQLVFEKVNAETESPVAPIVENEDSQVDSEQITCAFCSKICDSFATWRSHCHTMHDDLFRPFVCASCGADFKMKQHLDYHNNVVHLELQHFECDLCGKIFFRKHGLRTHAMMHLGERRYRCNVCPAKFSIKAGLNRHMALHKNAENEEAKKKSPLQLHAWEQSYMCLYCGKHFGTSEARNAHEKNHSKTAINIDSIFNFNLLDILDEDQMSNL